MLINDFSVSIILSIRIGRIVLPKLFSKETDCESLIFCVNSKKLGNFTSGST